MPLDIELFISEIEKRPPLYDIKLKEYSDRNLKLKLWAEIFEKFVENWKDLAPSEKTNEGKLLQAKWKNLRTCFKREYEAQKNMPSGSAAKKRRKYMYFDQMLFLKNSVDDRETSGNLELPLSPETHNDSSSVNTENQPKQEEESSRQEAKSFRQEAESSRQGEESSRQAPSARQLTSENRKRKCSKSYEDSLLEILREKKEEGNR